MAANPYELRKQLLEQAQRILENKYHCDMQKARDQGVSCDALPPTTEDIIAEAEKLYNFVQTQ